MSNGLEEAKRAITEACESLKTSGTIPRAIEAFRDFLLEKNKAYGNSIYEPVRVFTNASIETLILVRLNDKATRLLKGESGGEDSFDDLLGYLILRKALPLYLESKEASDCVDVNLRTVPGSVVTESLKNRGLRVGMTFQEVRDNLWTQCEADSEGPGECTEGDPCAACKFLDWVMCTCGHPYTVHTLAMALPASDCMTCNHDNCLDFSLASWQTQSLDDVAAEVAAHVNANVDGWTAVPPMTDAQRKARAECKGNPCSCDWGAPHGVGQGVVFLLPSPDIQEVPGIPSQSNDVIVLPVSYPSEAPNLVESGTPADYRATHEKKPRINRATWHETNRGVEVIRCVRSVLSAVPLIARYARELPTLCGHSLSDVDLALDHLISTGDVVKHGKAKGTRYAVAGFTDWPAPLPRGKRQDDQFAEEEPPIIIGAHGTT